MDSQSRAEVSRIRVAAAMSIFENDVNGAVVEQGRRMLDRVRQEARYSGFSDADAIRAVLSPVLKQTKGCECWTCKARRIGERNEEIRSIQEIHV